jgi:hypothetical protein
MLFSCFLSPILISIDSIWRPTTKDAWKQHFWIFSSIELTCYSTSINNNIDRKILMFQNCEGIVKILPSSATTRAWRRPSNIRFWNHTDQINSYYNHNCSGNGCFCFNSQPFRTVWRHFLLKL